MSKGPWVALQIPTPMSHAPLFTCVGLSGHNGLGGLPWQHRITKGEVGDEAYQGLPVAVVQAPSGIVHGQHQAMPYGYDIIVVIAFAADHCCIRRAWTGLRQPPADWDANALVKEAIGLLAPSSGKRSPALESYNLFKAALRLVTSVPGADRQAKYQPPPRTWQHILRRYGQKQLSRPWSCHST